MCATVMGCSLILSPSPPPRAQHVLGCLRGYSYGGRCRLLRGARRKAMVAVDARKARVEGGDMPQLGALGSLADALRLTIGFDGAQEEADGDHDERHELDAHAGDG